MPLPALAVAGLVAAGRVVLGIGAKQVIKKGATEAVKKGATAATSAAAKKAAAEAAKKASTKKWQTFDPKGGKPSTSDYLRPRPNSAPDAATPPRVGTTTTPNAPTKIDPFGPNTKPFDPYGPKTNPWPDMPKVNPNAPKPAPAPRKPVTPTPKPNAPATKSPWQPKSTVPAPIPVPKNPTVTSPSAATQLAPALAAAPIVSRLTAFGTGAAAGFFLPPLFKKPKDEPATDKNWSPSAIV